MSGVISYWRGCEGDDVDNDVDEGEDGWLILYLLFIYFNY